MNYAFLYHMKMVKNYYERSPYYSVCDQYGVKPHETWMYGEWFYTTDYGIFGHEVKATERSPPDNLTRWIGQLFKDTFKALIKEDLYINIEKYQGVLEHALSKVDFSVGIGIYMLPSNLNLNMVKTKGYNNKILVSNTGMKIGLNRDINRDRKNLPVTPPDVSKAVISAVRHDRVETTKLHNLKMVIEKHNDEKLAITLLIVGTGLIAYHFW